MSCATNLSRLLPFAAPFFAVRVCRGQIHDSLLKDLGDEPGVQLTNYQLDLVTAKALQLTLVQELVSLVVVERGWFMIKLRSIKKENKLGFERLMMDKSEFDAVLDRAQGCLLGQFAGDSLGSLVEFKGPQKIRNEYPQGLKELQSGGTWNTLAGQPTDDSEMALALIYSLLDKGRYQSDAAKGAYVAWLESNPFDCGVTVATGLTGEPNPESQANGALMRVSPIGILGARFEPEEVAEWAMKDAELTHPNIICQQVNALMAMAIASAIAYGFAPCELYEKIKIWARDMGIHESVAEVIDAAIKAPPKDFIENQGWVLIAFHNALYRMLTASDPAQGIADTVMCGGDTDTNAAICGALLGAIHGRKKIPRQWEDSILSCKPEKGTPGVYRPRPEEFWPINILRQAEELVQN